MEQRHAFEVMVKTNLDRCATVYNPCKIKQVKTKLRWSSFVLFVMLTTASSISGVCGMLELDWESSGKEKEETTTYLIFTKWLIILVDIPCDNNLTPM